MNTDGALLCEVCQERHPERGRVCEHDREGLARQLAGIIRQVFALEVEIVPGARRADGDRVTTSKGSAPLPARLDVLSLLGPGSGSVSAMLHPKVRHWQTTREVDVLVIKTSRTVSAGGVTLERGAVITERRILVEWHQALARDDAGQLILTADDDQIGTLPPRSWLASWVNDWSGVFAGRTPTRRRAPSWLLQLRGVAAGRIARVDDPLADDIAARFGRPAPAGTVNAVTSLVEYLLTWLDDACDHPDVPIGDFAGELRSVSAELTHVLGEQPDLWWLGRCPARISDPGTGVTKPCGAGLWQDPHASQVRCPRCQSTWGPRRIDLMFLATEMRRTWPVDRRRRYTAPERETIRRPRCPGCGGFADVQWRDVTGVGERPQVWQPVGATCPAGCTEAAQVI